jgi:hypothetical protein
VALADEVGRMHRRLELARLPEAERITDAIQSSRVVGVLGEAEVGKSETIRQILGPSTEKLAIVALDLDSAAGEEQLASDLVREIASAFLGAPEFSTLRVGTLVPASIEAKRIKLAELIGVAGVDEALREWPSGEYRLVDALSALEALGRNRPTTLWVDHLESPGLTPRHPLDLDEVLWGIRELVQRLPQLRLILSGRVPVENRLLGPEAAFHQQGQWLSLDNPPPEVWQEVAAHLNLPPTTLVELTALTMGHPETMLLALLEMSDQRSNWSGGEVLRYLTSRAGALTARAMQHARSLHRLGGQVLVQVAWGQGPYAAAQRGVSSPQEIRKVLGRLQQAGLIRHDEGWVVVNPLIGMTLRSDLRWTPAPDIPATEVEDEI